MQNHHAFLLYGENINEVSLEEIYTVPSHDVTHIVVDYLGIDDVRTLSLQATQKPLTLKYRVFVIVTRTITTEAQNALLKLFEEPPRTALFFLVVPKEGVLIPTLRSRLCVNERTRKWSDENDVFTSFLSATYVQRLEMIASLTKNKDQYAIEQIITGAEHYAVKKASQNNSFLRSVLFIRSYIGVRGSSPKMLLEELALSLPKGSVISSRRECGI